MPSRNDQWLVTALKVFTPEFWNDFVRDVVGRLSKLEEREPELEALAAKVAAEADDRVTTALAAVIAAIEGAAETGMIMTVNATGPNAIGPGQKTLTIVESQREYIDETGYVVVRPSGDPNVRMSGVINSYDEETGELVFSVVTSRGEGGGNDWVVAYAAVVVEGPAGPAPEHQVSGNTIHWRNPDGSWGEWLNIFADEGFGLLNESQIASEAQALAGSDNAKAMTPLRAKQAIDARKASQAEAEGGVLDTKTMSPLRVKQAIDIRLANTAEAEAGTDEDLLMTPARTREAIEKLVPGYTEVGSQTLAGQSVVTFTDIPQDREDLRVEINGASHNGTSSQVNVEVSNDGGTSWALAYHATPVGPDAILWGAVTLFGYRRSVSHAQGAAFSYTGGASLLSGTSYPQSYGLKHTGGINAVRVRSLLGGFDAGIAKILLE